jgi:hypothetical protein
MLVKAQVDRKADRKADRDLDARCGAPPPGLLFKGD